MPRELSEAMFFGAMKGAYSGATAASTGYLAQADGGTLFLDEVGELALEVQAKLLRAIERKETQPLGATSARRVDVRICAATNVRIHDAIERGRFRRDLHARLAQREVRLPPIVERREEIPWLIRLQLDRLEWKDAVSARFVEQLMLPAWPSNARGVLSATERAVSLARRAGAKELGPDHVPSPSVIRASSIETTADENAQSAQGDEDERRAQIVAAWRAHQGDALAAARSLGMGRTAFYEAMRRYGIKTQR